MVVAMLRRPHMERSMFCYRIGRLFPTTPMWVLALRKYESVRLVNHQDNLFQEFDIMMFVLPV